MLRMDLATARELGMRQLTVAERAGDLAMRLAAYVALELLMFFVGEFSFVAELSERGLSLPPIFRPSRSPTSATPAP